MDILQQLYGPFFDANNWRTVVTSGEDWMIILSLVLIECLLSVDNAIVLDAQTQVLPDKKQQAYLIHFWEIKVAGAAYLMYLAVSHFYRKKNPKPKKDGKKAKKRILPLFWSVVVSIEMMDIVFSVDSVLASLAISPNPVIVLIGGLIGILAMRGIAEIIMRLMEIVPELETTAYGLIALIAIKLFLTIPMIDIEIPNLLFGIIVLGSIVATFIIHRIKN